MTSLQCAATTLLTLHSVFVRGLVWTHCFSRFSRPKAVPLLQPALPFAPFPLLQRCSWVQDVVEQWKRTKLPTDVAEHLSMEAYSAQLQDRVISQLRAHQIGCVMAFLSAQELMDNSEVMVTGSVVRRRVAPSSRLSFHLQVCLSPPPHDRLAILAMRFRVCKLADSKC